MLLELTLAQLAATASSQLPPSVSTASARPAKMTAEAPMFYPASALRDQHQGMARYEITIDEHGRPSDCKIMGSSGWEELDAGACHVALTTEFSPAVDAVGQPITTKYYGSVQFSFHISDGHIFAKISQSEFHR